ncbi:sulfonylurea receptor/ abc transporter [Culex quinquefasciatus]|uniref:Sulfonylurea receptor/ abc transporter n=1 Tax=Culex quinquefasciatus TaxID=7176 RepID=B0WGS3_CULQU|nr:sulfonylurea receptor/ abc transporter [Culex quinquefasciatus]|eukprot:XP_001847907.1 sulfonylurea receptor/ abc transporter [Culex quinquefasciatus]
MVCELPSSRGEGGGGRGPMLRAYIGLMGGNLTPAQLGELCRLNLYGLAVNGVALAGLVAMLVYVGWRFNWKRHNLLALHNLRSTLVLATLLVSVCEIGQYCLVVQRLGALQPVADGDDVLAAMTAWLGLFAGCVGLLAVLVGAVFVRMLELSDEAGLLYIVLAAQGVQSVAKYCKFEYINGVTEGPSSTTAAAATAATLPGTVALVMTLALAALATTDGITMYLELANLGRLPEEDSSRFHYDQFLSIYQRVRKSTRSSLWFCYAVNCWRMFAAGGFFKLLGDLCALVGPLCISNIVDYIAKPVTSSPELAGTTGGGMTGQERESHVIPWDDTGPGGFNLGNQSSTGGGDRMLVVRPLTWSELLANGWFVALVVLVSALAQGTFSQASTHIMDMEGLRLKNALQGMIYRKALLLSCWSGGGRSGGDSGSGKKRSTEGWDGGGAKTESSDSGDRNASIGEGQAAATPPRGQTATPSGGGSSERNSQNNVPKDNNMATVKSNSSANDAEPGTDGATAKPLQSGQCCQQRESTAEEIKHKTVAIDSGNERGRGIGNQQQQPETTGSQGCGGGNNGSVASEHGGATTDAGTITNLMSDDAFNVMSFVKIAHYVWAIPLKIGVVMYLLYQLLGVSSIIGSVVCIVTMIPLQFLVGKMMSANSKKASECTDERLRCINEVLLGIKLIKLSAWEGVFREKISHARRRELRHLDLDSCYWTIMMLLTHVSSVLITFVTVAAFTHLEEPPPEATSSTADDGRIQFTAARLFASLALFNQLTVPLFIFPITIPIILSAVVSTRRLQAFLAQPEVVSAGGVGGGRDVDQKRLREGRRPRNKKGGNNLFNDSSKMGENTLQPSGQVPSQDDTPEPGTNSQKNRKTTPNPRHQSPSPIFAQLDGVGAKSNELGLGMSPAKGGEDSAVGQPPVVTVRNGRFRWGAALEDDSSAQNLGQELRIERLSIPAGKLTIIVGRSGSGKSSLLAALLGEINHLSGRVTWSKTSSSPAVAYVPQRPWLLNATVRDNILFGEPLRARRYDRVLRACALRPDIELMPDGDLAEIGERGIKLSGGQRQRIAIARALYSPARLVIMDDPLSSLDNEVARFVFDHGIRRMLARQKRTVIVVTQRLQLAFRADNIIALESCAVCATGTLSEIESNYPQILRKWNAIIAREHQSREAQLSPGKTARERWKLFKNISKISLQRSHAHDEFYEVNKFQFSISPPQNCGQPASPDTLLTTLFTPLTLLPRVGSSMGGGGGGNLFGPRSHTPDLALPFDECHGEDVQLRRHHYSTRFRPMTADGRNRKGFSDGLVAVKNNSVFRTQSLQPVRDQEGPASIDERLLPAVPNLSPISSTVGSIQQQRHQNAADCQRKCFQQIPLHRPLRDWRKPQFRQIFTRLSSRRHRRMRRHSNPATLAGIGPTSGEFFSKGDSVKSTATLSEEESCRRSQADLGRLQQRCGGGSGRRNPLLRRLWSSISRYSEEAEEEVVGDHPAEDGSNRLINNATEERKYGTIPARMYWLYLQSSGLRMVATFFVSALAQQGLRVYTDFWLQGWTDRNQYEKGVTLDDSGDDVQYHFRVYALLSGLCIVLAAVSFPAGQRAGSNARRRLHRQLISSVLRNSIHFFQTVPLGRLMNRLSIDIAVVDKKIAATSQKLVQFVLLCLCAVLINSFVTPYFILLTVPICAVYWVVQKFYRCSSRELQRIESLTYSPIIAHFSETIEGVTTIRAYGQQARFTDTLFRRMEANNVAQVMLNCSNRWLGIALDYLGAIIVFVAILSALITASLSPAGTSSSLIGLAINYALLVPIYLNWVVKLTAEMEMYVGAVERIQFCIESSQERYRERNGVKYKPVPISWPQKGDIVFENVTLRYESQKENVITNLSLTIPAGQRIGICGRTGSGKSSLALALFGVLELVDGRILIDDVDIANIHTDELRSRLSIIPQEVMLFGGSLRENLDPRGHFSDLELWNCLEMAQLKELVVGFAKGLDTHLSEEVPLFSAGQRQLLCLARAVLRGSVCLVLDEATSSLDTETEKLVLDAAAKAFKGRTVLTIAHRLHSLFDYDRVIVLEHGAIVEDGCPRLLRKRPASRFATMVKASTSEHQLLHPVPEPAPQELQRIESLTYSPIIAHFSETIEGVTTIRAYGQQARFTDTLFRRMEANNVAQVMLNCSNRWLGIALDYLGAIIVFVAILSALITASLSPAGTSSSLIGLAINYALLVPIYLNWVVKLTAEMEMYVGAVERIQFCIESSQERYRERNGVKSDMPQDSTQVTIYYRLIDPERI